MLIYVFKQHFTLETSSFEITASEKELHHICHIHFKLDSAAQPAKQLYKIFKSQQHTTRAVHDLRYLGHLAEKYKDVLLTQYFVILKWHFEMLKRK